MAKKRKKIPDDFELYPVNILLSGVDRDLRNAFKAYCTRRGITMRHRLIELMEIDVKEEIKSLRRAKDIRKPTY